jgi:hypothetical protein
VSVSTACAPLLADQWAGLQQHHRELHPGSPAITVAPSLVVIVVDCLALTPGLRPRSIVAVVDKCLEEDLAVFRATVQDIVDELEVRAPP